MFAMSKAAAAITVFAFQVAAKTVLEQQERQKPHLPRRSEQQDAPKARVVIRLPTGVNQLSNSDLVKIVDQEIRRVKISLLQQVLQG